jgi:valyl-tRNA synthetase
LNSGRESFLLETEYPSFASELVFTREFNDMEVLKRVAKEARKIRAENSIPPQRHIKVYLKTESEKEKAVLAENIEYFDSTVKSPGTEIVPDFSTLHGGFKGMCLNWEILFPFDTDENRMKELNRLKKELEEIEARIDSLEKELSAAEGINKGIKKNLQQKMDKRNKTRKTINDII